MSVCVFTLVFTMILSTLGQHMFQEDILRWHDVLYFAMIWVVCDDLQIFGQWSNTCVLQYILDFLCGWWAVHVFPYPPKSNVLLKAFQHFRSGRSLIHWACCRCVIAVLGSPVIIFVFISVPRPESHQIGTSGTDFVDFWSPGQKVIKSRLLGLIFNVMS